jgi:hypothetical protein
MSVALLVLTLTVVGLSRLVAAHARLLDSMDGWCRGEPTLRVVPPTAPFESECGVAAKLAAEAPDDGAPPPAPAAFDVDVLTISRTLVPAAAAATVRVTAR